MEGAEFDELVADIKANGLREPIALWGGGERSGGQILDGRNRYRACLAAGIRPQFEHLSAVDPAKYVISRNIRRRHLTTEQKRELIAKLIRAAPEKSDRQIAETAKASPTTVGTVRAKMEDKGEVSKLDTRTDAKGVKQPAKKPSAKPASPPPLQPPEVRETIPQLIDGLNAEGRKNMATMSPGTVARLAALLERTLEEPKARDDIGADSRSERERLVAENEELRAAKRRLEIENEGLRGEIDELKAELAKRAPAAADGLDVPEFLRRAAPAQGRTS
jgi:hypothetical protein